jgi:flagellar biosynthetic protein FliQ
MQSDLLFDFIQRGFIVTIILAGPLLLIAAAIGFSFALFQSLTQIQDQALPQVVKILVILLVLFLLGRVMANPFVEFTSSTFSQVVP